MSNGSDQVWLAHSRGKCNVRIEAPTSGMRWTPNEERSKGTIEATDANVFIEQAPVAYPLDDDAPLLAHQLDDFMYHGHGASEDNRDIKNAFMSLGLPEKMVNDIMWRISHHPIQHIAAIAHSGGLAGMSEADALVAIRRLTLAAWDKSGDQHAMVAAACKTAEHLGVAA